MRPLHAAVILIAAIASPAAELTKNEWRENLAFLAKELPARHPNLFFHLPRTDWNRHVVSLDRAIPGLSDDRIRIEFMKLVAAVGDSHTRIGMFGADARFFYLGFREFSDGLYITDTIAPNARAMGSRVISLDGAPIEQVRHLVDELAGTENDVAKRMMRVNYLGCATVLKALGVIRDAAHAEFIFERDGRRFSMIVNTLPARAQMPEAERPVHVALPDPSPLWLKRSEVPYWMEYLKSSGTLFVQYNSCRNDPQLSFAEFTKQVVDAARETRPERLVIDLRNNGGGDSAVSDPLMTALKREKSLRPRFGRFVLIGERTFSSAELVALQLKRNHGATLAGEPTAQKPNSYGDIRTFQLPHGNVTVMHSTKRFEMIPGADPPSLMPDRLVTMSASDYFAGRDPVLENVTKATR